MKSYTATYLKYFHYGEEDYIPCERCGSPSNDTHHIFGRVGLLLNDINNLIALCRKCHNLAHAEKISKDELKEIHLNFMKDHGKERIFNDSRRRG